MNPLQEFAVRHPTGIALAFATLVGWCGFCAFRGGMATALLRGNTARMASEAMGG